MENNKFKVQSKYQPAGDQIKAISELVKGFREGVNYQTLLGVTGSGKTFTMANVIEQLNKPTLVIAHNKTLAAQLCSEFKEFFPDNAVEYFVSYYDYYQPEAYVPSSDTYIEKDSSINEEIEKLRHSATSSLFERNDVIIVASVSCIYGLGSPEEYKRQRLSIRKGQIIERDAILRKLVDIQYERNNMVLERGSFRVRGDVIEIIPASINEKSIRIEMFGDEVDRILEVDILTGEIMGERSHVAVFPATHYVTAPEYLDTAISNIENELEERVKFFEENNQLLEAQRIRERTKYDIEMLKEIGFCSGVENYSRHLTGRPLGASPYTLMDYFPEDFLIFIDESHMTIPQIGGMYEGDRSRKSNLVDYGFRLPSALDNRPLKFVEFEEKMKKALFVSATPGPYEQDHAQAVVEQI
ncbi:MAG: DEAD/DEAH box helicase family protein, partial [Eubacteriales bacterium]|nr:DEAD/DEAH box helicase family protein [Eubacteriales bacterium]